MNWRTTYWLLGITAALAAFVLLLERPARLARLHASAPTPALRDFDAASVLALEVARGSNQGSLRRTNQVWEVVSPARFAGTRKCGATERARSRSIALSSLLMFRRSPCDSGTGFRS